MYIESINISSYGGLHDFSLDLTDGVNLIEGNNESGKSTVCDFIRFIFFGIPSKAERQKRIGWGDEKVWGSLTCSLGGKSYKIFRSVSASGREDCNITDLSNGLQVFSGRNPGDVFLGVPEDIFVRTAYITQAGARVEGEKITNAIENILLSGNEQINTKKALKDLDQTRIFYRHKIGTGGRIQELKDERDDKVSRIVKGAEDNAAIISKEGSLREYSAKTAENEKKLTGIYADIDYYETGEKMKMVGKILALSDKVKELESEKAKINGEISGEDGFIPDREYGEKLKTAMSTVASCDEQVQQVRETAEQEEPVRPDDSYDTVKYAEDKSLSDDSYKRANAKRISLIIFGVISAIISFIGIGTGIFTFMADKSIGSIIAIISVGIFLIPIILLVVLRDKFPSYDLKKYNIPKDGIDRKIEQCRREIGEYEEKMRIRSDAGGRLAQIEETRAGAENEIKTLLDKWGRDNAEAASAECDKYFEDIELIDRQIGEASAAYNAANEQFGGAEKISAVVKHANDISLSEEGLAEIDIDRLTKEKNYLEASQKSMGEFITSVNNELLVLKATSTDINKLSDEVNALNLEIEKDTFICDALELAHKRLSEAGDAVRKEISPRLSKRAGEILGALTDGKYKNVGVSDNLSMNYETYSGGSQDIGFMSAGTMDLAYISLRFALVELLYEENDPPIIFDESFSRLDDKRLIDTLKLLHGVAADAGMQIVIFTSTGRDAAAMNGIGNANYIKI